MKIEYSSNNSGGSWWLTDENWKSLERAGWDVKWKESRFLGALAMYASKDFDSVKDCLEEFEKLTEQSVTEEGCNCCGCPHSFSWDGGYCSGESCLQYLYPDKKIPKNLREAIK